MQIDPLSIMNDLINNGVEEVRVWMCHFDEPKTLGNRPLRDVKPVEVVITPPNSIYYFEQTKKELHGKHSLLCLENFTARVIKDDKATNKRIKLFRSGTSGNSLVAYPSFFSNNRQECLDYYNKSLFKYINDLKDKRHSLDQLINKYENEFVESNIVLETLIN